jgi:hypothetical protein
MRRAESADGPHGERRAFLLLFGVTLLARLPFLFDAVINWDESTFLLMGADLLRGHLPYVHAWDNKPPLAFVPFAAALALFGKNVVGARVLGILSVFASAWVLRRAANRITGGGAGMWAAVLLILYAGAPPGTFATMSEHLTLPLFCLAMDRLLADPRSRRGIAATGLFLGTMVLIRTNMLYACLGFAIGLPLLSRKGIVPRLQALGAGAVLPVAAVTLVYAVAGRLDLFFRSVVRAPFAYASSGWLTRTEAVGAMARVWLRPETALLTASAALGVLLLVRDARRGRGAAPNVLATLALLLILLAASATGSGRFFGHYSIQFLPFAAIAAGRAFSAAAASAMRPILLLPLLVPIWPSAVQYRSLAGRIAETGTVFAGPAYSIAAALNEKGAAGEYAFFPEAHIAYLLTGTRIPTRFVHPSLIVNEPILRTVEGPAATVRSEILSIFAKKPLFVALRDDIFYLKHKPEARELFERILAEEYAPERSIDGFRIYVRRGP